MVLTPKMRGFASKDSRGVYVKLYQFIMGILTHISLSDLIRIYFSVVYIYSFRVILKIEDLKRVVISYEIYETSLRRIHKLSYEMTFSYEMSF